MYRHFRSQNTKYLISCYEQFYLKIDFLVNPIRVGNSKFTLTEFGAGSMSGIKGEQNVPWQPPSLNIKRTTGDLTWKVSQTQGHTLSEWGSYPTKKRRRVLGIGLGRTREVNDFKGTGSLYIHRRKRFRSSVVFPKYESWDSWILWTVGTTIRVPLKESLSWRSQLGPVQRDRRQEGRDQGSGEENPTNGGEDLRTWLENKVNEEVQLWCGDPEVKELRKFHKRNFPWIHGHKF